MTPLRVFGLVAATSLFACGANYRYVYDGEAAFERCYALDYDSDTNASSRQQCWSAWLQSYSFGAGVDRIEYARLRASGRGAPPQVTPPTTPAPAATPFATPQNAARVAAPPATAAPAATVTAGPWHRAQISGGGNPVGAPAPTTIPPPSEHEPPGAACSRDCHQGWHGCGGRCVNNDAACVAHCDDTFRDCMRGCF